MLKYIYVYVYSFWVFLCSYLSLVLMNILKIKNIFFLNKVSYIKCCSMRGEVSDWNVNKI